MNVILIIGAGIAALGIIFLVFVLWAIDQDMG